MTTLARRVAALALLISISHGALAATVSATSRLSNLFNADSTCTNSASRACDRKLNQTLTTAGLTTGVDVIWDFTAPGNVSGVPNYIYVGTAGASAVLGTLKAFVEVGISGAGGGNAPSGINGVGEVLVKDAITIVAPGLAAGTPVAIRALFDVFGTGRGSLQLDIRGSRNGISLSSVFFESSLASNFGDELQDIDDMFIAMVGETLQIEYALVARAASSITSWNGLPRSAAALYGNSASLYFAAVDPALGIDIVGQSGFNYLAPASVPLPGALALLVSAVGTLGAARRRRAG